MENDDRVIIELPNVRVAHPEIFGKTVPVKVLIAPDRAKEIIAAGAADAQDWMNTRRLEGLQL